MNQIENDLITYKELAQIRVDVKRALRKQLRENISRRTIVTVLVGNDLEPTDYLIDNLERIADRYNRSGLMFDYNSELSTPHFQDRDEIRELIKWLLDGEGYPLIKKWDDAVNILTGASV